MGISSSRANTLCRESAQSEIRASLAMPRDAATPSAVPFSRVASATTAASSNGSRSISQITLDSRSRPADSVADDKPSTIALARLARHPRSTRSIGSRTASGQPLPPRRITTTAPAKANASITMTGRSSGGRDGAASAHAISGAGSMRRRAPALTTAMRSRRSIRVRNPAMRDWRSRTSGMDAADDSHAARRSSPIGVRAPEMS